VSTKEVVPSSSGRQAGADIKHVAVIAVHGVGQHSSGESANAMGDLLLGLNGFVEAAGTPYSGFESEDIDMPLPGPKLFESSPQEKAPLWTRVRTLMEERIGFFEDKYRFRTWFRAKYREQAKEDIAHHDVSTEFMDGQIEFYKGDPKLSHYPTCRLAGIRKGKDEESGRPTAVHIYEMHWADLARPANSILRFFFAFFQLLLHLNSLGRMAVDQAALEHVGETDWFLYQRFYNYAVRVLTLGIFNLLVLLPVVAFAPLPLLLPRGAAAAVAIGVLFAGLVAVVLLVSQSRFVSRLHIKWWSVLLLIGTVFLLLAAAWSYADAHGLLTSQPYGPYWVLEAEWWLGAMIVLLFFVFPAYDEVRNGAKQIGFILTLVTAAGFAFCVPAWHHGHTAAPTVQDFRAAAFLLLQLMVVALGIAWLLCMALAILATAMEVFCRTRLRLSRHPQRLEQLARARAAARTARFTLGLSTTLILLTTLFLWSGIYRLTIRYVHLFEDVTPQNVSVSALFAEDAKPGSSWFDPADKLLLSPEKTQSVLLHLQAPAKGGNSAATTDPNAFLDGLLLQGAPPGLSITMALMAAGFLLLVLLALPSARYEVSPADPRKPTNSDSEGLGNWLSSGFRSLHWTIWAFWLAAFVVPAVYLAVTWFTFRKPEDYLVHLYTFWGMSFTYTMLSKFGALVAGFATAILGGIVKSASVALDIILDVDNYLRTSPADKTPRARIIERYLALLRFVHSYRTSENQPYDRIVIVAHSLGALISADFFRFLTTAGTHELSGSNGERQMWIRRQRLVRYAFAGQLQPQIPTYLFTMGNPIRQLLDRFFPVLYGWIRPVPDGVGIPNNAIGASAQELGVVKWRNSYRSGDYVGRSVWIEGIEAGALARTKQGDGQFPDPPQADEYKIGSSENRIDSCIGLGAHTHYWDRTAPDIAEQLDAFVRGEPIARGAHGN
jgi:hypothetical protein